jgi:hypothetical protein
MIGLLLAAALGAPPPVALGLRASAAVPTGETESGRAQVDGVQWAFPLEAMVAWRLRPELAVGLQGGYAPALVAAARTAECADTGVGCGARLWRLAARGEYAWRQPSWFPWMAATAGWEWQSELWTRAAADRSQTRWGGPTLGVELGIDAVSSRRIEAGVYVGCSLGAYVLKTVKSETAGYPQTDTASVASPALHQWLWAGVRVSFGVL